MLARVDAYLHRNRHETFYFRRSIPSHLAHFFATNEIYKSLATRDRVEARYRALVIAVQVEGVFQELHRMSKEKPSDTARTNLEILLKADADRGFEWLKLSAEPHEEELAARLGPKLLRAALDATGAEPGNSGITGERLTELIERYCREQTQWTPQSRADIRGDLLQVAAIAGYPLSTEVSRPVLSDVRSILLKLPLPRSGPSRTGST